MSEALDRDLSFGQRLKLRLHLLFCLGCRRFQAQMAVLREVCQRFSGRM